MLSLKLIDKDITDEEIRLLMKWRKKVQPIWHETFKVTYEGTKKWLFDLCDDPHRMLFFIVKDNKLIGNIGFDYIDSNKSLIGNVIRGRGKSDGSITKAMKMLIEIGCISGDLRLKVLKTNTKAINFYKRLGFKKESTSKDYYEMEYVQNIC